MKIAPIDIAHKTFGRKLGGYDPEEVLDFLRAVSDELESIIRERNALKETLREKELAISEYRERDELLKSTITTATKMSEKIQKDAEREAKLILHDAEQKADLIQLDARDSLKRIYHDITDLKRIRMQFENNMKALIQSHMTMLDQGQKVMPSPSIEPALNLEIKESVNEENRRDIARDLESRVNQAVMRSTQGSAEY
jgi:cell division initiation protein